MAEIYGHRWQSSYGPFRQAGQISGAVQTWRKGLARMSAMQIADGIRTCLHRGDDWPPTLPQFRRYCLGVPEFESVRANLRGTSAFSRLVRQYLDDWAYRHATYAQADKLLAAAYRQAIAHLGAGGQCPPEQAAVPEPAIAARKSAEPGKPAPGLPAEQALSRMKDLVGKGAP